MNHLPAGRQDPPTPGNLAHRPPGLGSPEIVYFSRDLSQQSQGETMESGVTSEW